MSKRITWPPRPKKATAEKSDIDWMRDGEPSWMPLESFEDNGDAMTTNCVTRCCDCGLEHMHTFDVLRSEETTNFWLVRRSYRLPKNRVED